jgi:hypothetical protein
MLVDAWSGMRAVFRPPTANGCTYVEKNMLGILALVLLVSVVPEIPLHHVLFRGHVWWIAVLLDAAALYVVMWVFELYGDIARMPHEIGEEHVRFYCGSLALAELRRDAIEELKPILNPERQALRKAYPEAEHLGLPGTDLVYVRLREPARVMRTFPKRIDRGVSELLVPSDRPHELCALLRRESVV